MLLLFSIFIACQGPYPGACEEQSEAFCGACEEDPSALEQAFCACMEEGTLKASSFPKEYGLTNGQADQLCEEWLSAVTWPGPEQAAACRQDLALMRQYGKDACAYVASPPQVLTPVPQWGAP